MKKSSVKLFASFITTNIFGFIIDISFVMLLMSYAYFSIGTAVTIGFFSAALFNLIIYKLWAFNYTKKPWKILLRNYLFTLALVLTTRLLSVNALSIIFLILPDLLIVLISTIVSLCVNFFLNKNFVF
jgi:putative flippase GtrA